MYQIAINVQGATGQTLSQCQAILNAALANIVAGDTRGCMRDDGVLVEFEVREVAAVLVTTKPLDRIRLDWSVDDGREPSFRLFRVMDELDPTRRDRQLDLLVWSVPPLLGLDAMALAEALDAACATVNRSNLKSVPQAMRVASHALLGVSASVDVEALRVALTARIDSMPEVV